MLQIEGTYPARPQPRNTQTQPRQTTNHQGTRPTRYKFVHLAIQLPTLLQNRRYQANTQRKRSALNTQIRKQTTATDQKTNDTVSL